MTATRILPLAVAAASACGPSEQLCNLDNERLLTVVLGGEDATIEYASVSFRFADGPTLRVDCNPLGLFPEGHFGGSPPCFVVSLASLPDLEGPTEVEIWASGMGGRQGKATVELDHDGCGLIGREVQLPLELPSVAAAAAICEAYCELEFECEADPPFATLFECRESCESDAGDTAEPCAAEYLSLQACFGELTCAEFDPSATVFEGPCGNTERAIEACELAGG